MTKIFHMFLYFKGRKNNNKEFGYFCNLLWNHMFCIIFIEFCISWFPVSKVIICWICLQIQNSWLIEIPQVSWFFHRHTLREPRYLICGIVTATLSKSEKAITSGYLQCMHTNFFNISPSCKFCQSQN